jgi:hypothetical protein
LAKFDAGNLCNCVGLIGRFKLSRKEIFLSHWLGSKSWINTGTSQEQKFLDSVSIGCVNHIAFNDKVIVDEISRVGIVGVNASNLGCGQENVFGFLIFEKILNIPLDFEIQLLMGLQDEILVTLRLEAAKDGRANEARMTSYVYLRGLLHIQA